MVLDIMGYLTTPLFGSGLMGWGLENFKEPNSNVEVAQHSKV